MKFSPSIFTLVLSIPSLAQAGLVAHWTGNGTPADSVASRDGTLVNGTGYDSGILGQSFRFDGANDYVSVADDNVWTFGNDPFSIALWVNFNSVNAGSLGSLPNVFVGHDQGGGTQNKWVFFYDDDGPLSFHINGPAVGSVFLTSPTNFNPTAGDWHHLAITRSSNTYTFYADGTSLGTRTDSRAVPNAIAPLTFGQSEGLGFLDGRMDDIRLYDHALSAAEISQLSTVPEPSGLILIFVPMCIWSNRRERPASILT